MRAVHLSAMRARTRRERHRALRTDGFELFLEAVFGMTDFHGRARHAQAGCNKPNDRGVARESGTALIFI